MEAISAQTSPMIFGLIALFLAFVVGVVSSQLSPGEVFQSFPFSLFITIFAFTLLVKLAEENGTFEKLTRVGLRLCHGQTKAIPFFVFGISALLSAGGVGNIATTALMAPAALSIANSVGLNPFLMTLMVIGGANASVMSPFSPTGLIARGLIAKYLVSSVVLSESGFLLFFSCFVLIGFVHVAGFFLLGGLKWFRVQSPTVSQALVVKKSETWSRSQLLTLGILGLFFVLNILFGVEQFRVIFSPRIQALGSEIGVLAIFCLLLSMAFRVGSTNRAVRHIPWGLLFLVCGMATLVSVAEKTFGFGVISQIAAHAHDGWVLISIVSFASAALSVFSSSSGVVMPLFLAMIPALVASGFRGGYLWLVTTVIVSSHLVDCSPFSTLGALSLAALKDENEDSRRLFRQLTVWGLSMVLFSAVTSAVAFIVINF